MTNVIQFEKPEADDLIWRCSCGCATHYVHADGHVECAQCEKLADSSLGEWRKSLPAEPEGAPEFDDGDTKVVDWGSAENAVRMALKRAEPEQMIFLAIGHANGRLTVWGQDLETDEQQAWLERKLDEVARLLAPPEAQ